MIWVGLITFVLVDTVVAYVLIRHLVRGSWGTLEARFPPHPPAADAVARRFQSFKLGLLNLGGCVHVTVDERFLHLAPARFIRWFGAADVSVPWSAVEIVSRKGRWATARVADQSLSGPAWCLELAEPDARHPAS